MFASFAERTSCPGCSAAPTGTRAASPATSSEHDTPRATTPERSPSSGSGCQLIAFRPMPGIDDPRANLLHEAMSRPIRLFLPAACALLSLGLSACVGTLYDRMYSNKKN